MKRILSALFIALVANSILHARVVPFISPRSQGEDAARELVLWQTQINQCCHDTVYGSCSALFEFSRSLRPERLARALFGTSLNNACCDSRCPTFLVQGSLVPDRDQHALLADYFGLPTDYNSTISVEPRIENILAEINLYIGLDQWASGLYFRMHAPIVHTRWDLRLCEKPTTNESSDNPYPLGYFNGENVAPAGEYYGVARRDLVETFIDFVGRKQTPAIQGVVFQPLYFARMSPCAQTDTMVAEIQAALGWNFLCGDDYHAGINLRAAAPTGTRPRAQWLFEPIVGNSKHWELGAGFSGHYSTAIGCSDDADRFGVYLDVNITHLFKARQCRTFDLRCKELSRYMLAQKINLVTAGGKTVSYTFADEFAPVANLSTRLVNVNAAVQADAALKFAYTHQNFQFDLGYEFWARSCEKITPSCDCCGAETQYWALKGDAFVYGFISGDIEDPTPLQVAERDASIFCGTNNAQRADIPWTLNPGVDNAILAFDGTDEIRNATTQAGAFQQMYRSDQALSALDTTGAFNNLGIFTNNGFDHLDSEGAQTKGFSNKLFGNIGHIWSEHERWIPYLGFGAEVEFGKIGNNHCCKNEEVCHMKSPMTNPATDATPISCAVNDCCCKDCSCCFDCAISQWGIWLKGGISF